MEQLGLKITKSYLLGFERVENESVIEERFQASISQNALLGVWSIVLGGFPSFSLSH